MRILDNKTSDKLETVILYLTTLEAEDLKTALEDLLATEKTHGMHIHVGDKDYKHEVTVCLYDQGDYEGFSARSKKLIETDE